ncbi:MAG: hypothetical protein P4L35_10395 [Ignavibacteriaceae bacterium]|nr:hypothetical protein [Ignavibacteriaceae bacterium]
MIRKNRDTKFIIYQVLYIFVITVLALKGANLDLSRVVKKDTVVSKSVRDSLVALIDTLYKKGVNFNIKVDENAAVENVELKEKLAHMNERVADLTKEIREAPPDIVTPQPIKEESKEQTKILQSPLAISQTFIQNTWNKAKNTGNVPTYIYDSRNMSTPITVVSPGQEKVFDLTDQKEIIVKFGSQEQRVPVNPRRPTEIKITRATTKMDASDIYVTELQRITGFTVTIIDERPDQLKVSYSGPISVNGPTKDAKGNMVYQVTLNIASSEQKFNDWTDRNRDLKTNDGKYKANFFFTAVDQRTKNKVQVGDAFYFTDYSK